jgi:hypothetical protein
MDNLESKQTTTGSPDLQPLALLLPALRMSGERCLRPPLWWVDNDYTDKKVVIIGSAATAVTTFPETG